MSRELEDLPYARFLTRQTEPLVAEGDYDCVHLDGGHVKLDDVELAQLRFTESAFTDLVVTRGSMRHTRFVDVWQRGVRWIGTELADTTWQDVEIVDGALSGADFGGASLRRVRFEGCKLDSVNFRRATLREVTFVECVLRDCDFGAARLHGLRFPGTKAHGLGLHAACMDKVDFRGAVALDVADGVEALRSAVVSPSQLFDLAPTLARAAGIIVRD